MRHVLRLALDALDDLAEAFEGGELRAEAGAGRDEGREARVERRLVRGQLREVELNLRPRRDRRQLGRRRHDGDRDLLGRFRLECHPGSRVGAEWGGWSNKRLW